MGLEPSQHRERARHLRREATAAEARLWEALRGRQLDGLKFVRQQPIGPFIADFVCRGSKLVIEVDGPTHEHAVAYDAARTKWLEQQGYAVIRISNEDVFGDLGPVLERIRRALPRL